MGTVPSAVWDEVRRAGRGTVKAGVAAEAEATEAALELFVEGPRELEALKAAPE